MRRTETKGGEVVVVGDSIIRSINSHLGAGTCTSKANRFAMHKRELTLVAFAGPLVGQLTIHHARFAFTNPAERRTVRTERADQIVGWIMLNAFTCLAVIKVMQTVTSSRHHLE